MEWLCRNRRLWVKWDSLDRLDKFNRYCLRLRCSSNMRLPRSSKFNSKFSSTNSSKHKLKLKHKLKHKFKHNLSKHSNLILINLSPNLSFRKTPTSTMKARKDFFPEYRLFMFSSKSSTSWLKSLTSCQKKILSQRTIMVSRCSSCFVRGAKRSFFNR